MADPADFANKPILLAMLCCMLHSPLVRRHRICAACCRYKLGSERFITHLQLLRSFVTYETLQRMKGALALLRQLLWHEPLPYPDGDDEADKAAVARRLIRDGQVIHDTNNV